MEYYEGDITHREQVLDAVKGAQYVYNYAAIADLKEALADPVKTCEINVLGCVHTLEAAQLAGVKRYIFASSVYVYSESGAFYRASKQAAERFIEVYEDKCDLSFTILRYGSLYGRGADIRNGVYNMLRGALLDGKIVYAGNGEELREYIHVADAAAQSVEILRPEYENQHIVLTGHEKMRIRDMVHMIQELLPSKVTVEYKGDLRDPHYSVTPYAFSPRVGKKLVVPLYTDIGQGLLDCIKEIDEKRHYEEHGENEPINIRYD